MLRRRKGKRSITGSPQQGEPVYIALGFLRRAHGVQGEIVMDVLTDFPERVKAGRKVYVGDERQLYWIASARSTVRHMLIRLRGIDTPEDAVAVRNKYVYIRPEEMPALPEGTYYHHQIIGMAVIDEAGAPVGELTEVLQTGANDVYMVRDAAGAEILLPAIEDVIINIDLAAGQMTVRPPQWG